MRKNLHERVKEAVQASPGIVVDIESVREHGGYPLSDFENLGISKADLKRLENAGIAIRGYENRKTGYRVRWVLVRRNT